MRKYFKLHVRRIEEDEGILITMPEFKEAVKTQFLIDYDGHGNYAINEKWVTTLTVIPSDIETGNLKENFPYILWYNR